MRRAGQGRGRGAALGALIALVAAACSSTPAPSPSLAPPSGGGPTAGPSRAPSGLRLVVDTDMAPDDIVAIASLLRDPAVDLLAITVTGTGEAHCQGGMFVARSIVTMLREAPVPVTCGSPEPIGDAEPFPDAWRAGADAGSGISVLSPTFAPDPRSASDLLLELARGEAAAGRRLTVLTLGTLTNLGTAVKADPSFAHQVDVLSMLGAVGVPGNVQTGPAADTPVAEWNAHADPTAVRIVLEAGFDLTLVPLDATNDVPMSEALYGALGAEHGAGPADLVYELWSRNEFTRQPGSYLWDPLAAAAVRDRSVVTLRDATLRVIEGAGNDGGRLVEDAAGAHVTIATAADRPAFEALLLSRLRLGPPRANAFQPVATLDVTLDVGRCDVTLQPDGARAGLLRITGTNAGAQEKAFVVFGLGQVTWSVIEQFAAHPPAPGSDATAPPVAQLAFVTVPAGSATTAYGETTAGQIGVACIGGTPQQPEFTLAGPLTIKD